MIWIIGEYAERIDNADDLLGGFLESFPEETAGVQLQLLTATVGSAWHGIAWHGACVLLHAVFGWMLERRASQSTHPPEHNMEQGYKWEQP